MDELEKLQDDKETPLELIYQIGSRTICFAASTDEDVRFMAFANEKGVITVVLSDNISKGEIYHVFSDQSDKVG